MLDNKPNQPTKFRTKNWVEINNEAHGMYNTNSQMKFKSSMLKSSLCDYDDVYILVIRTITAPSTGTATNPNNRKNITIKICAPFTDCISGINNRQTDNAIYR